MGLGRRPTLFVGRVVRVGWRDGLRSVSTRRWGRVGVEGKSTGRSFPGRLVPPPVDAFVLLLFWRCLPCKAPGEWAVVLPAVGGLPIRVPGMVQSELRFRSASRVAGAGGFLGDCRFFGFLGPASLAFSFPVQLKDGSLPSGGAPWFSRFKRSEFLGIDRFPDWLRGWGNFGSAVIAGIERWAQLLGNRTAVGRPERGAASPSPRAENSPYSLPSLPVRAKRLSRARRDLVFLATVRLVSQ